MSSVLQFAHHGHSHRAYLHMTMLVLKPNPDTAEFCSYNMVTNNVAELSAVPWDYVVADEVWA